MSDPFNPPLLEIPPFSNKFFALFILDNDVFNGVFFDTPPPPPISKGAFFNPSPNLFTPPIDFFYYDKIISDFLVACDYYVESFSLTKGCNFGLITGGAFGLLMTDFASDLATGGFDIYMTGNFSFASDLATDAFLMISGLVVVNFADSGGFS